MIFTMQMIEEHDFYYVNGFEGEVWVSFSSRHSALISNSQLSVFSTSLKNSLREICRM